jgi:3-hydroxyisobutyrate dehydrogenase
MKDTISPSETSIGWIGIGVMGKSMAMHILNGGYKLTIYNRTREKATELLEKGAEWSDTPKGVAQNSDIVFTMVGFPSDVEGVYFSEEGIINGLSANKIAVDMTTTNPSIAENIYKQAGEKGAHAVDAPVSGGDVGAKNASLSIMAGGDKDVVEHIMPLFQIMGKNIVYQGSAGSGQHTKMCNQIVIAGTMVGVCESLLYGYKSGLDLETMLSSVSKGAAGCWTLDNLAPRIVNRNFDPGFFVDHFVKDMGIALEEARRMKISLPGLALAHQLYLSVQAQGHGKKGTHALMLALEHMSGLS